MVEFSERAQIRLDKYMRKVSVYLRGCKTVNADDIIQNIMDHIASEVVNSTSPISDEELDNVLKKLGSPEKWVPQEEWPWWKKIIVRLQVGPEDWRLSYLSFAFLLIGILCLLLLGKSRSTYINNEDLININLIQQMNDVTGLQGSTVLDNQKAHTAISGRRYNSLLFLIFLFASFIFSRATVNLMTDQQGLIGKKWLIYPSLIAVYVPILCFLILWPVILLGILINQLSHLEIWYEKWLDITNAQAGTQKYYILLGLTIVLSLSLWWALFWSSILKHPTPIKNIFRPFFDGFSQKIGKTLFFTALGITILSCIALTLTICVR